MTVAGSTATLATTNEETAPREEYERSASSALVRNSLTGSGWTLISRLTGMARVVAIGAVLGATYLGNTYQAVNSLPNLIYYQLLAGSLFVSLLVPSLVAHIRDHDLARADAFVSGFLGSLMALALAAVVLLVAAGPLILRLLSLGVSNGDTADAQRRVGFLLLVMFAPQILLYVIAGTGAAVMNAFGRFGLAAAAPTVENLGIILMLVVVSTIPQTSVDISTVSTREVLLLGIGTTAAVALHAALQWFGARRNRISMYARAGWRDPEIRMLLRRIRSVLGYTGLAAFQLFVTIIVANRVAGGLVAFQLALNFFYLPTAIVTWPIARALVPRLANFHQTGQMRAFRDEFFRAIGLSSFVVIPVAVAYGFAASALAHAIAFGQLSTSVGTNYIAVSMIALCPAVIAEAWFTLGSHALYAQQNVAVPFRAMALRVTATVLLMIPALVSHGARSLLLIGFAIAAGSYIGAVYVCRRVSSPLPPSDYPLVRSLVRTSVASALMVIPAVCVWIALDGLSGSRAAGALRLTIAALVGAATFVVLQARLKAPEIQLLLAGVSRIAAPRRGALDVTN
jgi:putative peptidoglycan lipid II flippase